MKPLDLNDLINGRPVLRFLLQALLNDLREALLDSDWYRGVLFFEDLHLKLFYVVRCVRILESAQLIQNYPK